MPFVNENHYAKIKATKTYKNYDPDLPQHPYRMLIIGPSNSGKTNILLNLIKHSKNYDKIYPFAKKLDEPLYQRLTNHFRHNESEDHERILEMSSSNISEVPPADDIDEMFQNLIIFDDMVTEKNLKGVTDLFIRGRKQNASIIFITQSYYSVPKDIRLNCDYYLLTKINSKREITEIGKDIATDKFIEVYNRATMNPYSFLVIDRKTHNPKRTFRANFNDAINI